MGDDVVVEIWDDPIWRPALEALQKGSNPKPLAKLLREGLSPPLEVTERLGILLDPPKGYVGPKLTVKTPKRGWDKVLQSIAEDRKLRKRISVVLQSAGKLESAIATVQKETGLSRSKLFQVWGLDNYEVVVRSQVALGYGPRKKSPRKTDKTHGL
jgi:hypothetical protein